MLPSHLKFYTKHGISPVRYLAASVQEHFERRASLYRSLGLVPLVFRGARCLEVAVGSGQNSLYISSLAPESLTLVEPNPTGVREIRELYDKTEVPHTPPVLVESTLQEYSPSHKFDIVICENWLGKAPGERMLLRKLAGFLEHHGMMVITTVPPAGFLPNMVRRALAVKYCDPRLSFDKRTETLVEMFQPHLSTITSMTRSATDWVQDNMINPAYFDLCITIPDVLRDLDGEVTALSTNPSFACDWRWFKSLHGDARGFNRHMVHEYEAALHNFMDYQLLFSGPDRQMNRKLEMSCVEFVESVRAYERAAVEDGDKNSALETAITNLEMIVRQLGDCPGQIRSGLEAGLGLLRADSDECGTVGAPSPFSRLFGRETVYLSMIRS